MKKFILGSKISNLVLSWFNFILFFAMRCCWSGISKTLGYEDNYDDIIYYLMEIKDLLNKRKLMDDEAESLNMYKEFLIKIEEFNKRKGE